MFSGAVRRFPDWATRLAAYLEDQRNTPFCWGDNDCATFACGGVEAMTGVNPARDFAIYDTVEGAATALGRHGFEDLKSAAKQCASDHRMPRINPKFAQRGDLVLIETKLGQGLGLIDLGAERIVMANADGLARLPRSWALMAWRV